MTHYFVTRGADGQWYIASTRLSYAEGPGDFHSIERNGFKGPYASRAKAEWALDILPIKNPNAQPKNQVLDFDFEISAERTPSEVPPYPRCPDCQHEHPTVLTCREAWRQRPRRL